MVFLKHTLGCRTVAGGTETSKLHAQKMCVWVSLTLGRTSPVLWCNICTIVLGTARYTLLVDTVFVVAESAFVEQWSKERTLGEG